MEASERALLHRLLTGQRLLSLGVMVDGDPYVGLLPFARTPDRGGLLVHASRLARHSRGLAEGAPFSALVHAPDEPEADPLQVPRVTLQGRVRALPAGSPAHAEARDEYLARLPSSRPTFQLGDFALHELRIESGRFVVGFGRTLNLDAGALRALDD